MKVKLNFSGAVQDIENRIDDLTRKQDDKQADKPDGALEKMDSAIVNNRWRMSSLLGTLLDKKILNVREVNEILDLDIMEEAVFHEEDTKDKEYKHKCPHPERHQTSVFVPCQDCDRRAERA